MDLKRVLSFPPYPGDYLHPVVYACTAVMLLCLLVSIMTYVVHHSMIRISRNGWHTLINFLFHIGLTFGVFAGGINQINLPFVCQTVGIVLHYASLSTMLWLTFTARNICKDVSKDQLQTQSGNRSAQAPTKPTILRFYLVSDGIPLIIVGVTAAFGMDNYGSRNDALYCWMAWELSLGGFFAPMSLLVIVMSVYFLCTYIQLKRHPERKYELQVLSEEQQQLSLSESDHQYHHNNKGASGPSGDCQPVAIGMSVLGNEHSFKSQLLATAFTLFLFLATWALGALAVSQGHVLDMIFSCLYGAFCVSLGLFLLIQHCAKRDDVWHHWWACCMSKPKSENGNEDSQSQRTEFHQPHCHLSSSCSAKQPLPSPHLVQSSYCKLSPPPQSSTSSHPGPFCMAMIGRVNQMRPLTEPMPSLRSQSLSNELPHLNLPLHSCLKKQTKSHFNLTCSCLQDYPPFITSSSMDGSVDSSHLNSSHAVQNQDRSPLVSSSPDQDNQVPCISPQMGKQLASCHSLQHQTSCHSAQDSMASCHRYKYNMYDSIISFHSPLLPSHKVHSCQWHMHSSADHSSTASCCEKPNPFTLQYQRDPDTYSCLLKTADGERNNVCVEVEHQDFPRNTLPRQNGTVSRRGTIGRNRSLQEDGLLGSVAAGNIQTGPWRNETTV